jgi:phage shock protein C
MEKRLYRSRRERILGGVCGGIAEYFGLDPSLVRIVAVLLILVGEGRFWRTSSPGFSFLRNPEENRKSG